MVYLLVLAIFAGAAAFYFFPGSSVLVLSMFATFGSDAENLTSEDGLVDRVEMAKLAESAILEGSSDGGYARPESVNLEGCQMEIVINYERNCPKEGYYPSVIQETGIIDLIELSSDSRDVSISGVYEGAELLSWGFHEKTRIVYQDLNERRREYTVKFPNLDPNSYDRDTEMSEYIKRLLDEAGINSRKKYLRCDGYVSVRDYVGSIGMSFKPGKAKAAAEILMKYKRKYCAT